MNRMLLYCFDCLVMNGNVNEGKRSLSVSLLDALHESLQHCFELLLQEETLDCEVLSVRQRLRELPV